MSFKTTHTFAVLEVSESTFKEIHDKLKEHYSDQIFNGTDGNLVIDMHGVGIQQGSNKGNEDSN